jgi:hypothetical protein
MRKGGEMADEPREDRTEAMVVAFVEHRKMEQTQDYLARGRRFATLDVGQLSEDWIIAVRSWLARKNRAGERMMDDLTAELQLRGFEPPYDAVKQQLAARFSNIEEVEQKKVGGELARQIDMFMRERNETPQ